MIKKKSLKSNKRKFIGSNNPIIHQINSDFNFLMTN